MLVDFDKTIKPLFNTIENNVYQTQTLTQLCDTLLPKLMNGEFDVDKVVV